LSDMKLAIVLAWHVRYLKFVERTGTAHTIARRMGVSEGTIYDCIRRRGRYTHLSTSCSNHMSRARRFQGDEAEIQARALLLKKWRRGPSLPAR
jgi:transposase